MDNNRFEIDSGLVEIFGRDKIFQIIIIAIAKMRGIEFFYTRPERRLISVYNKGFRR